MNLTWNLISHTKINSKLIIKLNVNYRTRKLLGDKLRENLWKLRFGEEGSDMARKKIIGVHQNLKILSIG